MSAISPLTRSFKVGRASGLGDHQLNSHRSGPPSFAAVTVPPIRCWAPDCIHLRSARWLVHPADPGGVYRRSATAWEHSGAPFRWLRKRLRHERSRVSVMGEKAHFTAAEARAAGERVGIDWALS